MNNVDHTPAVNPSPDQQRDALRKGLGRAWQWSQCGVLDEEILLNACLRDLRYDQQVDDGRGDWLWGIIAARNAADQFRSSILEHLSRLGEERNADQLCELGAHYARRGDTAFRDQLLRIVTEKPFPDSSWLAEKQIIAVDGESGFRFAARIRGAELEKRAWSWEDDALIDAGIEQLGAERVDIVLSSDEEASLVRFREAWREEERRRAAVVHTPHAERMRAISVDDIIAAAESSSRNCGHLRGWGYHADATDLTRVLNRLWAATEPGIIVNYLRVLSKRALPEFDVRLIDLCRHSDAVVRRRALTALEQNAHPLVREFALSELESAPPNAGVIGLFIRNCQPRDEDRILESLDLSIDEDQRHWLMMNVIDVLQENAEADPSQLAVVAYAGTPCSRCRRGAAGVLRDRGVAPDWLIRECAHDCDPDTRELFHDTGGTV